VRLARTTTPLTVAFPASATTATTLTDLVTGSSETEPPGGICSVVVVGGIVVVVDVAGITDVVVVMGKTTPVDPVALTIVVVVVELVVVVAAVDADLDDETPDVASFGKASPLIVTAGGSREIATRLSIGRAMSNGVATNACAHAVVAPASQLAVCDQSEEGSVASPEPRGSDATNS
jgi:hypothetical protein